MEKQSKAEQGRVAPEKLLHERLREHEGRVVEVVPYILLSPSQAEAIADEIERDYIPRPRFEDGEPVQHSDMKEIGAMATCSVYTDGSWCFEPDQFEDEINPKEWYAQAGAMNDRIKRPTPKVLDVDGVEIRVGDYGYGLIQVFGDRDDMLKVERINANAIEVSRANGGANPVWIDRTEFAHERPVFDANGERICKGDTVWSVDNGTEYTVEKINPEEVLSVEVVNNEIGRYWYKPEHFTHREPDSLNKVLADMMQDGRMRGTSYIPRVQALIERGA